MNKLILLLLSISSGAVFAVSPTLLAKQNAAMTYGVNSNARVVGSTIYVPTTTRFDNKTPSVSSAYQNTVSDMLSQGKSMSVAQSMAKNGPSYTSLNAANLNSTNSVNSANTNTTTSSKYVASSPSTSIASTANSGLICGYSGATPVCAKSLSQRPANFRK